MIKTAEELRARLDGKTERSEIEAVLNGATVGTLKSYVKEEGFDCTGYHTWKKADFVETIAVALMEDIAKENFNSEEEALIVSTQPATPAEKSKLYITFVKGRKYRGKLNGVEQILTVTFSDSEHDLVSFETEDGRSYVCAVNYETQAAWGTSEVVVMRVPGMTLRVNARNKVHGTEEAPIENAQVLKDTQTGFNKGANREIVKMLLEALSKKRHATESQSESLYEDDAYADDGGDNSAQEQDIPEAHTPDEPPALVRRQHTMRVIMLANKYAEARGTAQAIRDGIKTFRKCIKMGTRQGLSVDGLVKAIKGVREKYREWRVEAFKLRRKLLRVMSAAEIRLACEAYTARCEEIRRGHLARK